ncbi:MAG: hemerythrin domain-containing protein [Phycisphaerales bacterium]|nr:hemerythrin domain-containing protein [Phycisphaerales bacterium]
MSTFKDGPLTPPLARHPALRPLSREHMGGLILARRLERAVDARTRLDAVVAFVGAWRREIRAHFDDEERLLLPLGLALHLQRRLLDEHAVLRAAADRCELEPERVSMEPGTVESLGRLLRDHIRWEERVLFEYVQRDHPGAVDALCGCAHQIERERPASRPRYRLDWSPDGHAVAAPSDAGPASDQRPRRAGTPQG